MSSKGDNEVDDAVPLTAQGTAGIRSGSAAGDLAAGSVSQCRECIDTWQGGSPTQGEQEQTAEVYGTRAAAEVYGTRAKISTGSRSEAGHKSGLVRESVINQVKCDDDKAMNSGGHKKGKEVQDAPRGWSEAMSDQKNKQWHPGGAIDVVAAKGDYKVYLHGRCR